MTTYVALLRGINVGGRNRVAMSDLRDLCADLGLAGTQTLLQSGNLVFACQGRSGPALEHLLERESAKRLGVPADYVVRGAAEWAKIVARNPFPEEAQRDPSHLVVVFLKKAPSTKGVDALRAAIRGPETISADGKQLYAVYPAGIGRSKLTIDLIEQKLAARGTGRNWNTVLKLCVLCGHVPQGTA